MKKKFIWALVLFFLSASFLAFGEFREGHASKNFTSSANIEYKVEVDGKVIVTDTITIKNASSNFYAESFVLTLFESEPVNIKAYEKGEVLAVSNEKKDKLNKLTVNLKEAVVGKNESRTFVVSYEDFSLTSKNGDVWEVLVPKLSDPESFEEVAVSILIPDVFGDSAYISPRPRSVRQLQNLRIFKFGKADLVERAGVLGFGKSQVFKFNLKYHIQNTSSSKESVEIALPPDTPLQSLFYEKIAPEPEDVVRDDDGNWLATYLLKPNEKLDITAAGWVQILSGQRRNLAKSEPQEDLLKPTKYWQSDDPKIKKLADDLQTPQAIYRYIIKTLNYNYDRVKPDIERLGALKALENPKNSICMEFTDLFIAISRAAGIPAREINGFAYTENPKLQPLSLIADVLHSWPEYWDSDRKAWIPVDPTWESTSGIDFFNQLDLRHFAFAIHGISDKRPLPAGSYKIGSSPQKDVQIELSMLPEEDSENLMVSHTFHSIGLLDDRLKITARNPGPKAAYNISYGLFFDEKEVENKTIDYILPFSKLEKNAYLHYGFLGINSPKEITVYVHGSKITISPNKNQAIVKQMLFIFLILFLLCTAFFLKIRKKSKN